MNLRKRGKDKKNETIQIIMNLASFEKEKEVWD